MKPIIYCRIKEAGKCFWMILKDLKQCHLKSPSYLNPLKKLKGYGNKVLSYIQGHDSVSNEVSKYVEMLSIKKQIIKLMNSDPKNRDFILRYRNLYINYLYDIMIKPEIIKHGPTFRYDPKYKMTMALINSKDFYETLKLKFNIASIMNNSKKSTTSSLKRISMAMKGFNKNRFLEY